MADKDLDDAINKATIAMLKSEIQGGPIDKSKSPDERMRRRQAAAAEILRRTVGVDGLRVLRAAAPGGALDLPPPWPLCDYRASGGGPGFIDADVRTMSKHGVRTARVRIAFTQGMKPTQAQIAEGYERGRFELFKLLGKG